jgi:hypothetical protein
VWEKKMNKAERSLREMLMAEGIEPACVQFSDGKISLELDELEKAILFTRMFRRAGVQEVRVKRKKNWEVSGTY